MNHKQQLIEWLVDDVAPRARVSGDPHAELLKFANEKNLSPALLEAMGQLFNTAKTLAFMDKSAGHRGDNFAVVDVPALVEDYLKVEEDGSHKSASQTVGYVAAKPRQYQHAIPAKIAAQNNEWINMPPSGTQDHFPEDLFKEPAEVQEVPDWQETNELLGLKQASVKVAKSRAEIDRLNQALFDCNEDSLDLLAKWAKTFRQDRELSFEPMEADVLKVYGAEAKPLMDKVASYLASSTNLTIKRASSPGKDRLIDERSGFVADIGTVLENEKKMAGLKLQIGSWEVERDTAHEIVLTKVAGQVAERPDTRETSSGGGGSDKKQKDHDAKDKAPAKSKAPVREDTGPEFNETDASKSIFKTGPDLAFNSVLKPMANTWSDLMTSTLGKSYNRDQQQVDSTMKDTQSTALLQNLLTTDDVLSEADPEKVVAAYNTIRASSPNLANDINVMRVALRSAIQHDGIDPFAVKNFADTELSRLKVDKEHKAQQDAAYGGGSIKKPKSDDKDKD